MNEIIGNTVGTPLPKPDLAQTDQSKGNYVHNRELFFKYVDDQIAAIRSDMEYEPIDITGVSIANTVLASGSKESNTLIEMGATVQAVTVKWTLNTDPNKNPVSQTVNGATVEVDKRSAEVPGPFTTGQKFTVIATDERGATDSNSTSITFENGVYYGALATGATVDSAAVLSLTRKLQGKKAVTFKYTPENRKRPVFACLSSYGKPNFTIGPNVYEWDKIGDAIEFTNASGRVEIYDVWMHCQDINESVSITASWEG